MYSWERGSNENLNGLIRQYLPKGSSFRDLTQADCNRIARALEHPTQKRFSYKMPEQMFAVPVNGVALVG
jgi:IS30 family transposase